MTQQATTPAAPTQTTAEPGSGVTLVPSLEERSQAAFGSMEPAGDGFNGAPPLGDSSAAGSIAPDALAAERAARRATLAELSAKERERVDLMAQRRESDTLRQRLEAAEARAKAAEDGRAGFVDKSKLDNAGFFAMAQELAASGKLTPQQLGEWIREQTANPELAASRAATAAVDPKISALEKRVADQQAMIDNFFQEQTTQRQQAEERHAERAFLTHVQENQAMAPVSSGWLAEHGHEQFLKLALKAAQSVPPSAGPQAILDEVEENLVKLGFGRVYGAQAPQRTQAPTTSQNHAPAKAPTTISNTLAQQRATVIDEDADWASLPFEERSRRAFGM